MIPEALSTSTNNCSPNVKQYVVSTHISKIKKLLYMSVLITDYSFGESMAAAQLTHQGQPRNNIRLWQPRNYRHHYLMGIVGVYWWEDILLYYNPLVQLAEFS